MKHPIITSIVVSIISIGSLASASNRTGLPDDCQPWIADFQRLNETDVTLQAVRRAGDPQGLVNDAAATLRHDMDVCTLATVDGTPKQKTFVKKATANTSEWIFATAKAAKEEIACRADQSCIDARDVAIDVCRAERDRDVFNANIKAERENPSGVVDLQELHDEGECLRYTTINVQRSKAHHLQVSKKPWNDNECAYVDLSMKPLSCFIWS